MVTGSPNTDSSTSPGGGSLESSLGSAARMAPSPGLSPPGDAISPPGDAISPAGEEARAAGGAVPVSLDTLLGWGGEGGEEGGEEGVGGQDAEPGAASAEEEEAAAAAMARAVSLAMAAAAEEEEAREATRPKDLPVGPPGVSTASPLPFPYICFRLRVTTMPPPCHHHATTM